MAADGHVVMELQSHVDWFARALALFNRSLLRQLPRHYVIRFDVAQFLSSVSFDYNGERQTPSLWRLAPDPEVHDPRAVGGQALNESGTL